MWTGLTRIVEVARCIRTPSTAQSESLVKRLNRCNPDAIDAEWELIILSALD